VSPEAIERPLPGRGRLRAREPPLWCVGVQIAVHCDGGPDDYGLPGLGLLPPNATCRPRARFRGTQSRPRPCAYSVEGSPVTPHSSPCRPASSAPITTMEPTLALGGVPPGSPTISPVSSRPLSGVMSSWLVQDPVTHRLQSTLPRMPPILAPPPQKYEAKTARAGLRPGSGGGWEGPANVVGNTLHSRPQRA